MERITMTLVNNSSVSIDLCKASIHSTELLPNSSREILTTNKSWIHGHSKIGSFIITRDYENFEFKSWGKLILKPLAENNSIVEILEKK